MVIRPTTRRRMVAGIAAVAAVGGAFIATAGAANATPGPSTELTISKVAPTLIAATKANVVITVTGTGFDESTVSAVQLSTDGGTTPCGTPIYIVASPTTLVVKTTDNSCGAGAATLTVSDDASNTVANSNATGSKTALTFVAPPELVNDATDGDDSVNAVTTEATTNISDATKQVTTVPTGGGSIIRVSALTGFPFTNTTTQKLTATLGGVALSSITMGGQIGSTNTYTYFTAKTGAHAAGDAALVVTSAGITVSYPAASLVATGGSPFQYAGNTIAVAPAFGNGDVDTNVTITGSGTHWASADSPTVTVGGVAATSVVVSSATKITCTFPALTLDGTAGVDGSKQVVVTDNSVSNIISVGSVFTYLSA